MRISGLLVQQTAHLTGLPGGIVGQDPAMVEGQISGQLIKGKDLRPGGIVPGLQLACTPE